jgi:subtilisin family serine protease
MPTVKGKDTLCSCEKKYFKSFQGLEGYTLFDRFTEIENVINKRIDEKFRHFLAEPIDEGDSITWFSTPYKKTPVRLSELRDEEKTAYEQLKKETLSHYKSVIEILKNEGKNSEALCLEDATKFVNDEFVYCYDNKVVLGIWGMQLKENVREPLGVAMKNLYIKKKETHPVPPIIDELPIDIFDNLYKVNFDAGDKGILKGTSQIDKKPGEFVTESDIPVVEPKEGYEFIGWDRDPFEYSVNGDTAYTAQYKIIEPIVPSLPWYKRFWNWLRSLFFGRGCLKLLLWLLLLLLLLLLFCWLLRGCNHSVVTPIPDPISEKPWIHDDPRVGDDGGIYHPGNPYKSIPTPPEYSDILPPNQGVLPPMDTNNVIRDPGKPVILNNRLNILMENEDKSIMDLAKEFKKKYPAGKYKVVYYDDVVKRMQIEVPAGERQKIKTEIPAKFAPEYELFVFDEALFENGGLPNDPALADPNKSWYLKAINATQAWDISLGSPKLTIAIVDNGFSLNHPELKSKVVMPYNVWLHSKDVFSQPIDHGTHVAGTALAIANNSKGLCGIAPQSAFMPVQVANKQGLMTTTSILDGILYALYQGADVINVSLGMQFSGTLPESEQNDLQNNHFKEEERLWNKVMEISNKHNAIIVVAAGNTNMLAGINPMNRPKNFIIVSAVDKRNQEYVKAGFSNFGNYSTVSAPGVDIYSTVGNNGYTVMSGTSMAAPIVTGAVALMKSLKKELSAEQIVCILQGTGKSVEGKVGNLVQIDKALDMVKSGRYTDCKLKIEKPSTGDVQILLSWNNYNDLDLVCTDPNNQVVWYKNKQVSSGGQLEIDMNVNYPDNNMPIENIFWPTNGAPNGTYRVQLLYSKRHIDIDETPYKITVKYGDKTEEYEGKIKRKDNIIPICTFTLRAGTNNN